MSLRARGDPVNQRPEKPGAQPVPSTAVKHAAAGRQVAFVRGINVGRAKRVAMADLRRLIEELGFTDVRTVLNSGNLVFTAPRVAPAAAAARIEKALAAQLGLSARVTALTAAELGKALAENPLLGMAANPSRLLVAVLSDPADRGRLKPLLRQDWAPEALAVGARVAYVWCPEGQLDSRVFASVSRELGDAVTSRNWATMTKLYALV